eukprot:RCo050915
MDQLRLEMSARLRLRKARGEELHALADMIVEGRLHHLDSVHGRDTHHEDVDGLPAVRRLQLADITHALPPQKLRRPGVNGVHRQPGLQGLLQDEVARVPPLCHQDPLQETQHSRPSRLRGRCALPPGLRRLGFGLLGLGLRGPRGGLAARSLHVGRVLREQGLQQDPVKEVFRSLGLGEPAEHPPGEALKVSTLLNTLRAAQQRHTAGLKEVLNLVQRLAGPNMLHHGVLRPPGHCHHAIQGKHSSLHHSGWVDLHLLHQELRGRVVRREVPDGLAEGAEHRNQGVPLQGLGGAPGLSQEHPRHKGLPDGGQERIQAIPHGDDNGGQVEVLLVGLHQNPTEAEHHAGPEEHVLVR